MTEIDSIPPSLTSSTASLLDPKATRRFVVLFPDLEWEFIPAIHRIWELANSQHACVLLISLCKDSREESSRRRSLITLCAMLQDGSIAVETKVEDGTNWVDVVKRNYQSGDMIVCFAGQRAGLFQKPLSQILASNLTIPICVISGISIPQPKPNWLTQVMAWPGSIGIMVGFGVLQVKIVQVSEGWFQSILLILVIIPEIWLIWVWNNRFR